MLKGVSVARRKRLKPALVATSRMLASPDCAPRHSPTSCDREQGVTSALYRPSLSPMTTIPAPTAAPRSPTNRPIKALSLSMSIAMCFDSLHKRQNFTSSLAPVTCFPRLASSPDVSCDHRAISTRTPYYLHGSLPLAVTRRGECNFEQLVMV